MRNRIAKIYKEYSDSRKYFISFGIFILLYVIGIMMPLDVTPHYYNFMSRIWNWTEILIILLAVYYIIRVGSFQWKQAVIAFFLGIIPGSAIFALKPAIAEEVIFHFFLLAYVNYLLRGKADTRFKNLLIYILLIIPHEMLHYPDMFIKSPGLAVIMCILNGVLFGFPMVLLMKKKNLQMAIGMHWFIDFTRFAAGF